MCAFTQTSKIIVGDAEGMPNQSREARLGRGVALVILLADLYAGLAWMFSSPTRYSTAFFKPARAAFAVFPGAPNRAWGLMLALLALAGLIAYAASAESVLRNIFALLTAYWTFWLALDIATVFTATASLAAPGIRVVTLVGHIRPAVTGIHLSRNRREKSP